MANANAEQPGVTSAANNVSPAPGANSEQPTSSSTAYDATVAISIFRQKIVNINQALNRSMYW